jgi:hypothetical protein
MDENRSILTGSHSTTQRSTNNAENDTNGTYVMEANQNTTNINGKKRYTANRKTIHL